MKRGTLAVGLGFGVAGSPAGAVRLMQVEPSHFIADQNPLEHYTNVLVGVGFLNQLDAIFHGNLTLVAAGYNAGPGIPEAWEAEFGTSNWGALETKPAVELFSDGQTFDYVSYVMQYHAAFEAPSPKVSVKPVVRRFKN